MSKNEKGYIHDKTPYPVCTDCNSILLDYFAGWFKCSQCGKIVSGESIFYFLNEEGKDILFESIFYF